MAPIGASKRSETTTDMTTTHGPLCSPGRSLRQQSGHWQGTFVRSAPGKPALAPQPRPLSFYLPASYLQECSTWV